MHPTTFQTAFSSKNPVKALLKINIQLNQAPRHKTQNLQIGIVVKSQAEELITRENGLLCSSVTNLSGFMVGQIMLSLRSFSSSVLLYLTS